MKKTQLSLALATIFTLAACGGGGSSSGGGDNGGNNGVETKTITVIDGYLGNAEVYVDANKNGQATADEKVGTTDENGVIEIEESKLTGPLIVKAIVGQTTDSDQFGFIEDDFIFKAKADSDYVTPFTTLAFNAGQSLDAILLTLGLNELAEGDYLAAKKEGDSHAEKIHAMARSLTNKMAASEDGSTVTASEVAIISLMVDQAEMDGADLDKLEVDANGELVDAPQKTLQAYVAGETFGGKSINWALKSEREHIVFSEDGSLWGIDGEDPTEEVPYMDDGMGWKVGNGFDSTLYVSSTPKNGKFFFNVVGGINDIIVYSTDALDEDNKFIRLEGDQGFTEAEVSGKTFYLIEDDAGQSERPDPMFVSYTLNSDKTASVTVGNNSSTGTWAIIDGKIQMTSTEDNEVITMFKTPVQDNNLMVVVADGYNQPDSAGIMGRNPVVMENIYKKWVTK